MGRSVAVALFLSLAVNVFLGGYFIGRVTSPDTKASAETKSDTPMAREEPMRRGGRRSGPRDLRGGPPSRLLGRSLTLSDDGRAAVRQAVMSEKRDLIKSLDELQTLLNAVRTELAAEPFDREKAQRAISNLAEFHKSREEARTDLLLDVFEALPVEERAKVAEGFLRPPMLQGRRSPDRGPDRGPERRRFERQEQ